MEVTEYGTVEVDGGLLSVAGETVFEGTVNITSNGGTIRVNAGPSPCYQSLVEVGSDTDFTNGDIEIVFYPGYTPDPLVAYDLFDPIDEVDLAAVLATANSITTPDGWSLDPATGILRFAAFCECMTGPDVAASAGCQAAYDSDADTDVDLVDFAAYQQIFGE